MKTVEQIAYKLRIAYDGTAYHGWQVQPAAATVAGTLCTVFERVFGHTCHLVGASRTDAGVHAYDQVARLKTTLRIDPGDLMRAWNNALPHDIVLRQIVSDSTFYPHMHVLRKQYVYHFFPQRPLPFLARFGWYPVPYASHIDWDCFEKTVGIFVGMHNFSSFSRVEDDKNPVRTVDAIRMQSYRRYGVIQVTITGRSFLRYQIRRMLGAALAVASNVGVTREDIIHLLKHPAPTSVSLIKAAPEGLCLRKIQYQTEE